MKITAILTFLLATTIIVHAQDSSRYKASPDSSIRISVVQNGRFASALYTSGGVVLTPKEIGERVMMYPDAALEWHKQKSSRHATLFFGCFVVSSTIAGAIESGSHHIGASHVFLGAAVSALIAELVFAARVGHHQERAIEIYNGHFQPR